MWRAQRNAGVSACSAAEDGGAPVMTAVMIRAGPTDMEHTHSQSSALPIDPVCGMAVIPQQAAGKSELNGTTYYFCSPGCKKKFDENPAAYLGETPAPK